MRKKNERSEYTARHAAGVAPVAEEERSVTTEFPSVGEPVEVEPITEQLHPPIVEEEPPKKKRFSWFRRRKKAEEEFLEDEILPVPEEAEPEMVIPDDTREIILSPDGDAGKTRVIELAEEGGSHVAEEEPSQLMLDGFAERNEEEEGEPGQEETLRRIRQEKIQDFSQRREQHERELAEAEQADAEQSEVVPETETDEESALEEEPLQETLETFSLTEVRDRLQKQVHRSGVTMIISIVLEAILLLIALLSSVSPAVAMDPIVYLMINLVLFIGLIAANGAQLGAGVATLFKHHRLTTEGAITIASAFTVVHTALLSLNTIGVAEGTAPVLTAITGFGLLLVQLTHRLELNRVVRDFGIFAYKGQKIVIKRIDDDTVAEEIGRPAVPIGVPRVAYMRAAEETEGCAEPHGYDPATDFLKWYVPVTVALSFVVSLVYLFFSSWSAAVTLLCSLLAISSPVLILLSLVMALFFADNNTRKHKTAISDYRAAEAYGDSDAVALDAMELFPDSSVLLHGIKTFSGTRVDDAILDAASVSIRAGGPLSHVFRRMVLNKVDMLHEVDTLVYEQDMGLSGWISGRRILIGNRKLLDNHGIDIPSKDYEERYAKDGRQLVYLSIAGELSAMFVVSYTADPEVRRVLKSLTDRRITLLIRTCDQNVTDSLITSVFNLNSYYVELLNAPAGRSFETLVTGVSKTEPAEIVSAKGSLGMLSALAQCRRLRSAVRLFSVLQAVIGISGIVLFALLAFLGREAIPPAMLFGYTIIGSLLTALISLLYAKN